MRIECFVLQVREAGQALTRNGPASASSDRELCEPCKLNRALNAASSVTTLLNGRDGEGDCFADDN